MISYEALKGLPAHGSLARHYFIKNPTPWKEGYVVRFTMDDGSSWIGNFQPGYSYYSDIVSWPETSRILVIASGACYMVSMTNPNVFICRQRASTGYLFSEDRKSLFVADSKGIVAYGSKKFILWRRRLLGIDGIEFLECWDGIIEGRACSNPPDEWHDFRISASDGKDVKV